MRHPHRSSSPSSGSSLAPLVERVAVWSAGHRKTAVFGWLLLVIAAVMAASGTRHAARGTRHAARGTRHAARGTRRSIASCLNPPDRSSRPSHRTQQV
jgi:hypothetical protein